MPTIKLVSDKVKKKKKKKKLLGIIGTLSLMAKN